MSTIFEASYTELKKLETDLERLRGIIVEQGVVIERKDAEIARLTLRLLAADFDRNIMDTKDGAITRLRTAAQSVSDILSKWLAHQYSQGEQYVKLREARDILRSLEQRKENS